MYIIVEEVKPFTFIFVYVKFLQSHHSIILRSLLLWYLSISFGVFSIEHITCMYLTIIRVLAKGLKGGGPCFFLISIPLMWSCFWHCHPPFSEPWLKPVLWYTRHKRILENGKLSYSTAIKESGSSECLTRYQKILGSIFSRIPDFFQFSFLSNSLMPAYHKNTLHKPMQSILCLMYIHS